MATNPVDDPTDDNGVVDLADLVDSAGLPHAFHELYDLSARPELNQTAPPWNAWRWGWKPNLLSDLTKRENRYAHRVMAVDVFPFDASRWGQLRLPTLCECSHPWWMTWSNRFPDPTDRADETRLPSVTPPVDATLGVSTVDLWVSPHPWPEVDQDTGTLQYPAPPNPPDSPRFMGPRVAEDVILTNVIGFDVKVWDPYAPLFYAVNDRGTPADLTDDTSISSVIVKPGDPGYHLAFAHWAICRRTGAPASGSMTAPNLAPRGGLGAYVDLDYSAYPISAYLAATDLQTQLLARMTSTFSHPGNPRSQLARVYDTWSTHYENDGLDQDMDGVIDEGTDGFDSPGNGLDDDGNGFIDDNDDTGNLIVDDVYETETSPPYLAPLRGIQVQIRTFEPDSRQVRTVTLVMDFVTK